MKIAALIPVKQIKLSKTRLDLTRNQKIVLTELMLKFTILNLKKCKSISTIVTISEDESVEKISKYYETKFIFSKEKGVNFAIEVGDNYCKENMVKSNIIVPIDLIFLNPYEVELLISVARKHQRCAIIVPSMRMDGTNLLLRRPFNLFKTSYDDNSYFNHIQSSKKASAQTVIIKSINLSEDLDTMDDYNRIITRPINKLSQLISRITNVI
ncbi:MAG TPA: 2-phospho-L-lactate guanylyltransferase [Nitrososphaeraceae archaeon]